MVGIWNVLSLSHGRPKHTFRSDLASHGLRESPRTLTAGNGLSWDRLSCFTRDTIRRILVADNCGAVKSFVATAGIRSDAFRFSAIRWCCDLGCRFTAITRVQIPSGTPNRFKSLQQVSPELRGCKKPRFGVLFAPSKPDRFQLCQPNNLASIV